MSKKIEIITFVIIVAIAALLRLYQIGNVPPSPDWDEVSLGYNAYSIMLTGRDEYGELLPVIMRSFDDYKPALYSYFIIPFIKIFGLNTISVRLPSVVFGIIAVIATYFLTKELFKNSNIKFEICLPRLFAKQIFRGNLKLEIP
ncbi:phospholipid carrier-dependent glycosyltransferase, partial [Candidatus Parcubacteria bacterium]